MHATLTSRAWLHLQAVAAEGPIEQRADEELDRQGLVARGPGNQHVLSAFTRELMAAFLAPASTLRLQAVVGDATREADLWVAADSSGLEVLVVDGEVRLHTIDAGLVPTRVAVLLGLRPRPVVEPAITLTVTTQCILDVFERVPGAMDRLRQEIGWLWPDIASEIAAHRFSVWSVQGYAWHGEEPVSSGTSCFLDTAEGCLAFELGRESTTVIAVPTALIWYGLTGLFAAAGIG